MNALLLALLALASNVLAATSSVAAPAATVSPKPATTSPKPATASPKPSSGKDAIPAGTGISIIQPLTGSVFQVGQQLTITWSLNGPQNTDFNKGNITFEIGDGSNPNNVLPVTNGALTFAKAPIVGDLTAITTIPAVANGKNYTIKATFRDAAAGKFLNWFSPNFAVQGSSVVVPAASSSAAAAASSAAASGTAANTIKTISVTSEGRSSGISQTSVLLALVPALLLAF